MSYPDYVKQFRPKGTIVKRVNGTYYAYYATSKRVPEKNYPVQVIKGLAGKIDQFGFHPLTRAVVDTEQVIIWEYGFTNYLLLFEDGYLDNLHNDHGRKAKDKKDILRSIIVYLSPNSYLCGDPAVTIYPPEELASRFHISLARQVTVLGKICEHPLEELEPLKYICSVSMGDRMFYSTITPAQERLLERLEVSIDDIKR